MMKLNAVQTAAAITELGYPISVIAIRRMIERGTLKAVKEPVKEGSKVMQYMVSMEDVYKLYNKRIGNVELPTEAVQLIKQLKEVKS